MLRRIVNWFLKSQAHSTGRDAPDAVAALLTRKCELCKKKGIIHITLMRNGVFDGEKHLCQRCVQSCLNSLAPPKDERSNRPSGLKREIQIEVEFLIISEFDERQRIMFREVGGTRRFSFICGIFEISSMERTLKQLSSPRPFTYDAWLSSLAEVGVRVQAASIDGREGQTFYARLRLLASDQLVEVDMRPTDAINVALKADVPILMPEALFAVVSSAGAT